MWVCFWWYEYAQDLALVVGYCYQVPWNAHVQNTCIKVYNTLVTSNHWSNFLICKQSPHILNQFDKKLNHI